MPTSVADDVRSTPAPSVPSSHHPPLTMQEPAKPKIESNYKGFAAGVFSGVAKLTVGHPFDTIKVRLQTSTAGQFKGPLQCLTQTIRNEGIQGVYRGATPPLIGWMFMDSLLMGSMTLYRRLLNVYVFNPSSPNAGLLAATSPSAVLDPDIPKLPTIGHALAGLGAGTTVSFIAAPVEHVKARLQVQYDADKSKRFYKGPVDCATKLVKAHGIRGLYHGLYATMIFRSFFFFWWGSYDLLTRTLSHNTSLSIPSINFWAGGLSAQVFWVTCYPSDVVKQRIMTDSLGADRKFPRWIDAARTVYRENGWRGYWRGFLPAFLRSFPANAAALVVFEAALRHLP